MNSRKKSPAQSLLTTALSGKSVVASDAALAHAAPVVLPSDTSSMAKPAIEPNFLADEVCHMLKIGRTTLYKLVKSGELVPLRVTSRIRVWPLSTIEAFLASKERSQ